MVAAMHVEDTIMSLTREGQSDEQTLHGKAPGYIASLANKYGIPVVLLSGSLSSDLGLLSGRFSACFSIVNKPLSLEECMDKAEKLLYEQTKQITQLILE